MAYENNKSINVIDPTKVSGNINNIEDLYIYVDFTAESRGNTILNIQTKEVSGVSHNQTNLMGYKQGTKIFTTDYTEIYNQTGDKNTFEGFGIDSINIITNASYVPTVTIKFIDVKGQSFFNKGVNSPYSILTMFPPPIYKLKIKGYYGSTLEYKLHLLNYTTSFSADSGNFEITVKFVGNTFAPLADILFRYVIEAPYIGETGNSIEVEDKSEVGDLTTLQLISNVRTLNTKLATYKANNLDTISFQITKEKKESLKEVIKEDILVTFENLSQKYLQLVAIPKDKNISSYIIKSINHDNVTNKLSDIYLISSIPFKTYTDLENNEIIDFFNGTIVNTIFYEKFIAGDNPELELIKNNNIPVYGLNITKIFLLLYEKYEKERTKLCELSSKIQVNIDNITYQSLGIKPTIYNVFEIICNDIDILFSKLINVFNLSTDDLNSKTSLRNKIITPNKTFNNKNKDIILYPFPDIISADGKKIFPEATNDSDLSNMAESKFVNDFINSFINTQKRVELEAKKTELDEHGSKKWIPNNIYDIAEVSFNNSTPYISDYNPQDILIELLNRYLVLVEYTYSKETIYNKTSVSRDFSVYSISKALLQFISKSEGINLIESLNTPKTMSTLLDRLDKITSNESSYLTLLNEFAFENDKANIYFNWDNIHTIDIRPSDTNFGLLTYNEDTENEPINKLVDSLKGNEIFKNPSFNKEFKVIKPHEFGFTIDKNNLLYFHDGNNANLSYFIGEDYFLFNKELSTYIEDVFDDFRIKRFLIDFNNQENINIKYKHFIIQCILYYEDFNKLDLIKGFVGSIALPKFRLLHLSSLFITEFGAYISFAVDFINNNVTYYGNEFSNNFVKEIFNDMLNFYMTYKETFLNISAKDIITFQEYYDSNYEENLVVLENIINGINTDDDYFDGTIFSGYINDEIGIKQYLLINTFYFNKNTNDNIVFTTDTAKQYLTDNKADVINFLKIVYGNIEEPLKAKAKNKDIEVNDLVSADVDNNIKQEVYYSFKNLVDRWFTSSLTNENIISGDGYSIIEDEDRPLIEYFSFIDRAGNDIGHQNIIDISVLAEFESDFDVNVLSVFSKLLGDNGYSFFPLQNFLNMSKIGPEEIFKPHTSSEPIKHSPSFTCMYIGNTSSFLNNEDADYYIDDGVDFTKEDKIPSDIGNNENFFVFKVGFGENEQSIFNGIELNTEEHQPTNESLKMLSQILDGNVNEATPLNISQNLFSVYEQRSFTCKIDMLGNAMIQPTQYFQLENVPLFRGGYIILNVEHNIDNNNFMKTSFSGVRISIHEKTIITNSTSKNIPNTEYGCNDGDDDLPNGGSYNSYVNKDTFNINGKSENDPYIISSGDIEISKYLKLKDAKSSGHANSGNGNNEIQKITTINGSEIGPYDILANIKHTAINLYDVLFEMFDEKITLTSFYRNYDVNTKAKGDESSEHMIGYAIDFDFIPRAKENPLTLSDGTNIYNLNDIYNYIINKSSIDFNQLIKYPGSDGISEWLHISMKHSGNRKESFQIPK